MLRPSVVAKDFTHFRLHQAVLAIGTTLYPLWYLVVAALIPGAKDSLAERMAVAGVFLGSLLVVTFNERLRKHSATLVFAAATVLSFHMTYFAVENDMAVAFVLLRAVTILCCATILETRHHFAAFAACQVLGLGVSSLFVPGQNVALAAGCDLTVMIVSYATLAVRRRVYIEQLAKAEIINAALDCVIVANMEGQIIEFNPSAERTFGFMRSQVLGRNLTDVIVPPAARNGHENAFRRFAETGIGRLLNRRLRLEARRVDGSVIPIELTLTLITVEGSRHVAAFLRDLTDQQRDQATIAAHQAQLVEGARRVALGETAANLAHEINSPLMFIAGKARQLSEAMALSDNFEPDWLASVNRIEETSERIIRIMRSLLAIARDNEADPPSILSTKGLLATVTALCSERLRSSDVALIVTCDIASQATGREAQICQILVNLIENARAAVASLPERWIRVEVDAEGEMTRIAVTDSGKGIPPEVAAKIFQPFYTTKPAGAGTGLGLSIAVQIAVANGGELRYDSQAERTRFVLTLRSDDANLARPPA